MEMSLTQIAKPPPCLVNKNSLFTNKNRVKSTVKALRNSYPKRATVSSNWNVSNLSPLSSSSTTPTWFPRFEELDTTNMLLRQRIIFLGSQVDDMTADLIISQLLLLDAEDSEKDIKLFINSPGGSVTAVFVKDAQQKRTLSEVRRKMYRCVCIYNKRMGIYDAMKMCKADVSTICLGLAASMGAFLLATGTKGKRFCMPNSRVMIHQPLGTAGGKATEMSIRIREMVYHKVKLNKILSRVTGKPEEQIEVDTDRDNFMNPWEAKEYGLIDGVIDDGKPGLVAPIADAAPPPKTRVWDLWKVEGSKKAKKNLPTEHKMLQNGHTGGQEKKEAAPL
ncbi:hypothetical protein Gotur_000341 [Gossypium turneri]